MKFTRGPQHQSLHFSCKHKTHAHMCVWAGATFIIVSTPWEHSVKTGTPGFFSALIHPGRARRRRSLGQEVRRKHALRSFMLTASLVVGALVVVGVSVFAGRATATYEVAGGSFIQRSK